MNLCFVLNTEGKDFPCSLLGVPVTMQNTNACINLTSNLLGFFSLFCMHV